MIISFKTKMPVGQESYTSAVFIFVYTFMHPFSLDIFLILTSILPLLLFQWKQTIHKNLNWSVRSDYDFPLIAKQKQTKVYTKIEHSNKKVKRETYLEQEPSFTSHWSVSLSVMILSEQKIISGRRHLKLVPPVLIIRFQSRRTRSGSNLGRNYRRGYGGENLFCSILSHCLLFSLYIFFQNVKNVQEIKISEFESWRNAVMPS